MRARNARIGLLADPAYRLLDEAGEVYASPTPGQFGGHRRSRIYGRLDCRVALRAIRDGGYLGSRVFFADEHVAVSAGYRPCAACLPSAYRVWRGSPLPSTTW